MVDVHNGTAGLREVLTSALHLIVNTMYAAPVLPFKTLLSTLCMHERLINIGIPDIDKPFRTLHAFNIVFNSAYVTGLHVGGKDECIAILRRDAEKSMKPWIEVGTMRERCRRE